MYTDKVRGDTYFALSAGVDRVTCIRFKTLDFGPKPESHKNSLNCHAQHLALENYTNLVYLLVQKVHKLYMLGYAVMLKDYM